MTNIFLVSARKPAEDRFTSHWHYLLEHHPDLAQQIIRKITRETGIADSKLIGVVDHPKGFGTGNEPDFLFRCEDYDIVCEHKLESGLGDRQLERYCNACEAREKITYLVLIANQVGLPIPEEVKAHPLYLSPSSEDCPYFLWDFFYSTVRNHGFSFGLSREFSEYMDALGMTASLFGEWGDPFHNPKSFESFREIWDPVRQLYKERRVTCIQRSNPLGMEVRKPLPGVTLFYLWARKGNEELEHGFAGKGFYLRVFLPSTSDSLQSFTGVNGEVSGSLIPIDFRSPDHPIAKICEKVLVREYGTPLSNILDGSKSDAKERLVNFIKASSQHVEETLR